MTGFVWPIRVYYEDTDVGGVVYHASYLRFLERARTEWLRQRGFNQSQLREEHQLLFAVTDMSVQFRWPARLDDVLYASMQLDHLAGAHFKCRQSLLFAHDRRVCMQADVKVVCLHAAYFKPKRIPKNLLPNLLMEI